MFCPVVVSDLICHPLLLCWQWGNRLYMCGKTLLSVCMYRADQNRFVYIFAFLLNLGWLPMVPTRLIQKFAHDRMSLGKHLRRSWGNQKACSYSPFINQTYRRCRLPDFTQKYVQLLCASYLRLDTCCWSSTVASLPSPCLRLSKAIKTLWKF